MALLRCKWSGRTAPSPQKNLKSGPFKQTIALFLQSTSMTVAPCPHLNFKTNVEKKYCPNDLKLCNGPSLSRQLQCGFILIWSLQLLTRVTNLKVGTSTAVL